MATPGITPLTQSLLAHFPNDVKEVLIRKECLFYDTAPEDTLLGKRVVVIYPSDKDGAIIAVYAAVIASDGSVSESRCRQFSWKHKCSTDDSYLEYTKDRQRLPDATVNQIYLACLTTVLGAQDLPMKELSVKGAIVGLQRAGVIKPEELRDGVAFVDESREQLISFFKEVLPPQRP